MVSAEANILNERTSLAPLVPHSSPNKLDNISGLSEDDDSSLPKSRVICHSPGDQGEGDVRCDEDDNGEDDIERNVVEDVAT